MPAAWRGGGGRPLPGAIVRLFDALVVPGDFAGVCPGEEYGVFYYRYPGSERGRVFSVTEKRMPVLLVMKAYVERVDPRG